ncbi:MAG: hypothetical protein U9N85_03605 [Bacteroidota bacterium]|nr:hypothetical protein [Bacteroidota bacterium]
MNNKDQFFKEADIKLRELELKFEKAEINAEKQKQRIDESIEKVKQLKADFSADLDQLKKADGDNWETQQEAFVEKYLKDDLVEEVARKTVEYSKKTKTFLTGLGNKVSDFYHKSVDEMKKESDKKQ